MASGPIIEDCNGMAFAPYSLTYPEFETQVDQAELAATRGANFWQQVKDFKWHRAQASPNWSLLEDERRASLLTEALSKASRGSSLEEAGPGKSDEAG